MRNWARASSASSHSTIHSGTSTAAHPQRSRANAAIANARYSDSAVASAATAAADSQAGIRP